MRWSLLSVPTLISLGSWHSFDVLVMSTLAVSARPAVRRPVAVPPAEPMWELAAGFHEGDQPVATSGHLKRLRAGIEQLTDRGAAANYAASLDQIARRHPNTVLGFGAWHGDWTPWNMAWRRRWVQLWDWERFEVGVPVGMDRIHYVLSALARTEGFTARTILRALELPTARELAHPNQQEAVGLLYLASIARRYLIASQHDQAGSAPDRAEAALQAMSMLNQQPRLAS